MKYLSKVKEAIQECGGRGFEDAPEIWEEYGLAHIQGLKCWGPMVWSAPVLSGAECEQLIQFALRHCDDFRPNEQEEKNYQIDELIVQDFDPHLYDHLGFIGADRVSTLHTLFTGHMPKTLSSVQLARFTKESTNKTDWHVDRDSELTCVVSLDPHAFKGGGTCLRPYGPCQAEVFVPPLPQGHGLFFNGRYIFHKAEPVTSGERLVLVYWMMGGN